MVHLSIVITDSLLADVETEAQEGYALEDYLGEVWGGGMSWGEYEGL